jgi:hypothetical protein
MGGLRYTLFKGRETASFCLKVPVHLPARPSDEVKRIKVKLSL